MIDATLTIESTPFGVNKETGEPNRANSSQERILQWGDQVRQGKAGTKGIPVLYVQGGWRSGKTVGALTLIKECLEEYPGLRVLMGRKDFNDLRLSTMVSWNNLREEALKLSYNSQTHIEDWVNGSQVFFRELKDLEGLGGQEFGIVLISEPYELEEDMYIRLKGRASQSGVPNMIIMEGNPPNEGHWLHKKVYGDERAGIAPDPDLTYVEVPTDENRINLPDAYWNSLLNAPATWQRKYRLGKFGFTPAGQPVYDLFKDTIHVRSVPTARGLMVFRSWDSGARYPACLWAQRISTGQLVILYEEMGMDMGLQSFAQDVAIPKTNEIFPGVSSIDYGDPAMFARSPQNAKSDAMMLMQEFKIRLTGKYSTYTERKSVIDKQLSRLINGAPAILIHPRCKILIDALLGGYHYQIRRDQQAFGKSHQEPFKDGFYEHLANAFEYLIINVFGSGRTHTVQQIKTRKARRRREVEVSGSAVF